MNSTYTATTTWLRTLHGLAKAGELEQALISVFGTTEMTEDLLTLVEDPAHGDSSVLPNIVPMISEALHGHPCAYDAFMKTIYVDARVLEIPPV